LLVLSLKSSAGCAQEPAADAEFSNCYMFNAVPFASQLML